MINVEYGISKMIRWINKKSNWGIVNVCLNNI